MEISYEQAGHSHTGKQVLQGAQEGKLLPISWHYLAPLCQGPAGSTLGNFQWVPEIVVWLSSRPSQRSLCKTIPT